MIMEIEFLFFDDIPDVNQKWLAEIKSDRYKGTGVTGSSIHDCLQQLGISIDCLEDFKKRQDLK